MVVRLALLCLIVVPLGPDESAPRKVPAELQPHQGTWTVLSFESDGQRTPDEIARSIVRKVEGDHVTWEREGKSFAGTKLEVDPSTNPASLVVIPDGGRDRGKRVLGIYRLEGDTLTICMARADQPRPTRFEAGPGSGLTLMTFRRMAPEPPKPTP